MTAERAGCGSRTTMGHGDVEVCGQVGWGGVYECQSCQINRLTTALEDARTLNIHDLVRALDDQQMLFGTDKNVVDGEVIDLVFALRDMGFTINVPPEMEP